MSDTGGAPAGGTSSRHAWTSITDGWPDPIRTEDDYAVVRDSVVDYFTAALPTMGGDTVREVVTAALERSAAVWHSGAAARRRNGTDRRGPSPTELAAAARDAVLDVHFGAAGAREPGSTGPSAREDEQLALRAIGAEPDLVRRGLAELVADRERVQFLVVTQYLDLADAARTTPPRSAQVVRRLDGEVLDEDEVRRAITAFHARLRRIRTGDGRR
jgi:hypothetical protein